MYGIATYVVIFGYSRSLSEVLPMLKVVMSELNFSSVVADQYGIPRELNANTFAVTSTMAVNEIEDLIRIMCLDLPAFELELKIIPVDEYFYEVYR
ncbi:endoribonuclease GhoS [Salmonella enterica subsp. enterica serovar Typhimurium]|nr:endoribonuclease GhoS [Salmonella enterica subsp. enterica serovar Typhimurium]